MVNHGSASVSVIQLEDPCKTRSADVSVYGQANLRKSRCENAGVVSIANGHEVGRTDHPPLVVTFSVDGSPIGLNESRGLTHPVKKGGKHTVRPLVQ